MKFDVTRTINDLKGNPVKEQDKEVTLRDVCMSALLQELPRAPGTPVPSLDDRKKRWALCMKMQKSEDEKEPIVELESDEIQFLKSVINDIHSVLICGRANELLEQPTVDKTD
jgi:hypothetical protein